MRISCDDYYYYYDYYHKQFNVPSKAAALHDDLPPTNVKVQLAIGITPTD